MTNECWLGYHDHCTFPRWCECMCHGYELNDDDENWLQQEFERARKRREQLP